MISLWFEFKKLQSERYHLITFDLCGPKINCMQKMLLLKPFGLVHHNGVWICGISTY